LADEAKAGRQSFGRNPQPRASDHVAFLPKQDDREACQLRRPEIDLLATYDFTRHLQGYAGYSHFFPGEFIRKTGPSRDSDFFYGAIQYTF
jgi:hypothetical protein